MPTTLNQASNHGDAVLTTKYDDDYIARGYGFALEDVFEIPSATSKYVLIDYTTYTDFSFSNTDLVKEPRVGVIFILQPYMFTTAGPVRINIYRETEYSGGTPALYHKKNTVSDVEPQISITEDPTGTNKGDLTIRYLVGSQATQTSRGGTSANPVAPFIRDNTNKTLIEIVNKSGFDIEFSYQQVFFEI